MYFCTVTDLLPRTQVFDYNGNCVHIADCNCMFEELVYEAGESRMQDCNVWYALV